MEQMERISRRIKLQQLNVLLAVAHAGSMAKAGKHLAISQPVVSKLIAELEDTLGVRLFDRSPQGVEPTRYGSALIKRSVALFDDLRTSVGEIKFLADPTSGELRIGTTEPQAGLVACVIERLSRQYPGISFKVALGDAATLVERDLPERRVELAVTPLPRPNLDEKLEAKLLYRNRLRVVVSRRSRWANCRKISLVDLINEPRCTQPIDVPGGALLADAFLASGLPVPRMSVTSGSNHLITRMLADRRFVGISSDGAVYFDVNRPSFKILPIELPAPPLPINIVTLKNRTVSPVAKLFIDVAHDLVRPLVKRL
jgi:DNA-binding transcriptional LysR family regulator